MKKSNSTKSPNFKLTKSHLSNKTIKNKPIGQTCSIKPQKKIVNTKRRISVEVTKDLKVNLDKKPKTPKIISPSTIQKKIITVNRNQLIEKRTVQYRKLSSYNATIHHDFIKLNDNEKKLDKSSNSISQSTNYSNSNTSNKKRSTSAKDEKFKRKIMVNRPKIDLNIKPKSPQNKNRIILNHSTLNTDNMLNKYLQKADVITELEEPINFKDDVDIETTEICLTCPNEISDLTFESKKGENCKRNNNLNLRKSYCLVRNNALTSTNPPINKIKKKLSTITETSNKFKNTKSSLTPKGTNSQNFHFHTQTYFFQNHNHSLIGNNNTLTPKKEKKQPLFTGQIKDYIIKKEIGKGSYAVVKQALHRPSQMRVAIKMYDKISLFDIQKKNSVNREIEVLKIINHENVLKLYEVIETSKYINVITELIFGVSLLDLIKNKKTHRIEEAECKKIFYQIVSGINYCHIKNISHRDIKLENILWNEKEEKAKIIDFGFGVKSQKNVYQKFFCGTPSYMPPEIVLKKKYIAQYADIWSLGVLLYTMLCGAFPFRAGNEEELYTLIVKGKFETPEFLSGKAKTLIKKIIVLTPNERPTTEEILLDEWFDN